MANKKMIAMALILGLVALATGCSDSTTTPTAIDTTPPSPAANLNASVADGVVTLSWDIGGFDADLAGYLVTRENDGQISVLNGTPSQVTTFADAAPQIGVNIYHVYAVDVTGNESAGASKYVAQGSQHLPVDSAE